MSDYKATYSRLRDGGYGVRIVCDEDEAPEFEAGDKVLISLKDETKAKVRRRIDRVIWSGPADREGDEGKVVILASLVPDGGPSRGSGGGGGGSRRASSTSRRPEHRERDAGDDGDDVPFS